MSKYVFLVLILMKNTWGRSSCCHCTEKENDSLSHKGSRLQSYSRGRPVNSVLSKQLVISFASKKTALSTEQHRSNPGPIEVITNHKGIWGCGLPVYRLVLKTWSKARVSAQRDSEGLLSTGWIVHCNTERRRQFC